jgi:mono/diheme cytochrome c family protein
MMDISKGVLGFAAWAMLTASGGAYCADVGNGSALFQRHCVNCHGDSGMGMMPGTPDFSRGERLFAPDSELATAIRSGVRVMPAFEGLLTEQEILDVVAFLRTLQ